MTIVLIGLNHRTAPVELREKLALAAPALDVLAAQRQTAEAAVREVAVLSTCNRLEIYAVVNQRETGWRQLKAFIAGLGDLPASALTPHLYRLEDDAVVRHLMRVACGLDSMILGEPQILGQVTAAFGTAQGAGLVGPVLSHLFSAAIHAGKRARTESTISRYTTSVSHAAALMVLDAVVVQSPKILIVGAGEMAVLAAKALRKHGVTDLAFINRTHSRAEVLAAELAGRSLGWSELDEALLWADAVITATGAPHTVIYAHDVAANLERRQGRPLLLVDIALPRDVEVAVDDLVGVQRRDIDDLHAIVDRNAAQREAAVPQVESIVGHEQESFLEWYYSREVTPVIKDLRRWAAQVAQLEVEQALARIGNQDPHTTEVVNRMAHRIVNKLLHEPTVRLRGQAVNGNGHGYAHAVSELFGLDQGRCDSSHCEHHPGAACDLGCITSERAQ